MYHILIPHAGVFDSDVDIYVPYAFDLDFLVDLLGDRDFLLDYNPHFVSDGGNSYVDR